MKCEIWKILGKFIGSDEAQGVLAEFPDRPERYDETCGENQYHLYWLKHGLELFIADDRIDSIFLQSGTDFTTAELEKPESACFRRFPGTLPHELTFADSQVVVHGKLGTPFKSEVPQSFQLTRPYDGFLFENHWLLIYYTVDFIAISRITMISRL